ncbi:helix-turn-helix domain-containing protein [Microbacterium sp.]|uniref:helix-turn-helix domain-containing protein n=1 Tax=Microbacterium sp. TaxID=51671 RepID=UPI003C739CC9
MSIEAMTIALHHSRAKGATKLVLMGIANHDGDGGSWPSVATLAKYANASERTVQYAIKQLESLGEIRRHFQDGGRASMWDHLRPNRYEFLLRCPPRCDRTSAHYVPRSVTFDRSEAGELIPGPWHERGEAGCTPRGEAGCTPPGEASCTQTVPTEPSKKSPVDRRPTAMATEPQKKYIRHMQSIIGDWASHDDPEAMTCEEADGWIGTWMGDYRAAGGGRDRDKGVWSDEERRDAAF